MDTKTAAKRWIKAYTAAWYKRDPEAIARLFSVDASYRSHPFRPVHRGRRGILAYTRRAFGSEMVKRVRFGRPVVEGARVAVEYWATMVEEGREVTLAGYDMLRFKSDGRCCELRDYWVMQSGFRDPPDGWGK